MTSNHCVPTGSAARSIRHAIPRSRSAAGHLYLHVPFCPRKCGYCAFVTHIGSDKLIPAYVDALQADLTCTATESPGGPLTSIYFGGGTPSMLSGDQIDSILATVCRLFGVSEDCETTLEAHPLAIDPERLDAFRAAGVTRISFGIESLDPAELTALGREYGPRHVRDAITWSREAGFDNVAMDLMYGLPLQTASSWRDTLRVALSMKPEHLSLYPLSIEPKTAFARRMRQGTLKVPEDDNVVEMYEIACGALREAGYVHYEVANWCRPGRECAHNLAYWQNHEFYAVGVGAHGYLKPYRTERVTQTRQYLDLIATGRDPVSVRHRADGPVELQDTVMLNLRLLRHGLDLGDIRARFGVDLQVSRGYEIAELSRLGLITVHENRLRVTERGVPLANEVWLRLM